MHQTMHILDAPALEKNETNKTLPDHYAFRPTGSTTSALVAILQQMLTDNEYIAIVSLKRLIRWDMNGRPSLARRTFARQKLHAEHLRATTIARGTV